MKKKKAIIFRPMNNNVGRCNMCRKEFPFEHLRHYIVSVGREKRSHTVCPFCLTKMDEIIDSVEGSDWISGDLAS